MEHSTGSSEEEDVVSVVVAALGRRNSLESLPMLEETIQLVKLTFVPESFAFGSSRVKKGVPSTLSSIVLPERRKKAALAWMMGYGVVDRVTSLKKLGKERES